MNRFWDHAARLMEAAVDAAASGFASGDTVTVLIGTQGGIQLISNSDWPLDRIANERGAAMAYRVANQDGLIALTGQTGSTKCRIEAESPQIVTKEILRDQPRYLLE